VELDRVLLIADGDKITVGKPVIDEAKVLATVQRDGKGKKVIVYKFKAKVRYRRKIGHRQPFTTLLIDKIVAPGMAEAKPAPKTRRKKKEVTADGA
jgi:large subunit ribosomal protein L21